MEEEESHPFYGIEIVPADQQDFVQLPFAKIQKGAGGRRIEEKDLG